MREPFLNKKSATFLKLILSRFWKTPITQRLRAPPLTGLRLNKIFFYIFSDFARPPKNSNKEEESFVSAFCAIAQAEAWW